MASEDFYRTLVERYLAAYNAFDVPGILTLLHPDIVFENVSAGEVTARASGVDDFRRLAEQAVQLFSSRRQTIRQYRRDGRTATIEIDFEGVLAADLGPTMRTGDTLRLVGRSTFEFRDGKIARIVDES
jgi:ketosteroid isomerase-like protein